MSARHRQPSRRAVVAAVPEPERPREVYERDAAILAPAGSDDDGLDDLAALAAGTALDDLE